MICFWLHYDGSSKSDLVPGHNNIIQWGNLQEAAFLKIKILFLLGVLS